MTVEIFDFFFRYLGLFRFFFLFWLKKYPISKVVINYSGDMAFPCRFTSFICTLHGSITSNTASHHYCNMWICECVSVCISRKIYDSCNGILSWIFGMPTLLINKNFTDIFIILWIGHFHQKNIGKSLIILAEDHNQPKMAEK